MINGQTGKMPAMPITLSENSYVDLKKKESTIMSPTASALNKRTETVETATMNGVQCPVEVNTATTTTAPISYRLNNNNNINTSINNNSNNNNNNNLPSSSPSNHQHHRQQQSVPPIKRSANDFRFGKSIGEGSFSTVYLAKDIHTQKEYAIKVCEKSHIIREKKQEYIKREREVMHRLINSAGFVNLFCTFQDNKSLYFVMTYAKNGDLLPYINKVGSFDLNCTRFYAAEVVLALEEMHQRAIIHRDLKPENILLDENMHILIADFGSAKVLTPEEMQRQQKELTDNRFQGGSDNENSDEEESAPERSSGGRKRSFVGTAQYVSPEILKGKPTSRATDLWALGCIIYQMISGLPPFRALTEYLIFQKVLKVEVKFPDGFDKTAQDLVQKLLRYDPGQRIGSNDAGFKYTSIRTHPFFEGIQFDTLRHQTPPSIYPYLPGLNADDELRSQYRVPDHLEPGLDDKQLTRLLGLELGTSEAVRQQATAQNVPKNIISILQADQLDVRQRLLENQKLDKWHQFVENEVILKSGFVNKRKGLFARKRMLLLTTGPRLFYIDPVNMVKKGEIPWSPALRVEPKNFKIFFVHTPNRTYYLEDPEGGVMEWCQAIDDVRKCTYSLKN